MFIVGEASIAAKRLCAVTYEAMWHGIAQVKPGARLGDIGWAIQQHAEAHGYGVVRDLVGHGLGKELHEEPQVPNYGRRGRGKKIQNGNIGVYLFAFIFGMVGFLVYVFIIRDVK